MANVNVKFGTPKAVRLSYANVLKPRAAMPGQEPKYSCTLMIPKTDKATYQGLMDAAKECYTNNPSIFKGYDFEDVFRVNDGDGKSPKGKRYGEECHGYWLLNASSKRKPQVVDRARNEIVDEDDIYSGAWAKVGLALYPYAVQGNVGIAAGLNVVMKTRDDERLGGGASVDDYFDAADDEDDDL